MTVADSRSANFNLAAWMWDGLGLLIVSGLTNAYVIDVESGRVVVDGVAVAVS